MARRNKSSLLHGLLDVAQAIPLWANVLLAAGIYAGLHTYAGDHPPAMIPASAKLFMYVVPGALTVYYARIAYENLPSRQVEKATIKGWEEAGGKH